MGANLHGVEVAVPPQPPADQTRRTGDYLADTMIGTLDAAAEHHRIHKEMVGGDDMLATSNFGGLPYNDVVCLISRAG